MKESFIYRLHDREIAHPHRSLRNHRKLYSSRNLISNLDIVNELDGHSGCVNALSWSKSGSLLASGSDDQHLNIYTFQPDHSTSQFGLATTVATGHTQNIFSVKFMPHHNDRIVLTAAGDTTVRVFDLEHAGQTRAASQASATASAGRRLGRNTVYNGVRYLSDGDTDARVYRSHGDRVKRIVTESSPHLFLTCSEDGEVRQWDLRQPSSAYPSPRSGRYSSHNDDSVPPPLISYKRYNLDLNTISCSASQPHYIALGGAHLHALLHDRRMTGRDPLREAGKPFSARNNMSSEEEELVAQATRCVRKFAPTGQRRMKRTENGHITACKISDARPDEMIVSWSGDHIYSFDLIRTPDASSKSAEASPNRVNSARPRNIGPERKRKRHGGGSESSLARAATARASSRQRTGDNERLNSSALRIRYGNGQSEDIPLSTGPLQGQQHAQLSLTTEQQDAQRIAKATVNLRASLFGSNEEPFGLTGEFTKALGEAASILPDVDEIIRGWTYPMDPNPDMVQYQQTLRRNRESARRFVQAGGTLARVLGGRLQTPSGISSMIAQFIFVEVRNSDLSPSPREQFGYDFIKAMLLWLDSGVGRLIEGFTRPSDVLPHAKTAERLPIPQGEATIESVQDILIPKLLSLASDKPVVDVQTNRFERNDRRQIFPTERDAVLAFAAAVKIPFEDLSSNTRQAGGVDMVQAQDRQAALQYWGVKVARGILLNAAEQVIFTFVDRAFGGTGRIVRGVAAQEARTQEIGEEEAEPIQDVEIIDRGGNTRDGISAEDLAVATREIRANGQGMEAEVAGSPAPSVDPAPPRAYAATIEETESNADHDDNESHDDDSSNNNWLDEEDSESNEEEEDDAEDSSDPDEEDGVPNIGHPRFVYRSAFARRQMRERVEADVECLPYVRKYTGHCNVRTVKDVNYFGLDDEYVVSGSDDGNFFVWDARTSELVNLLEGDGEVVNVVQGHPHETMLAVSGIDHTIKIFSPDSRAREAARLGNGISAHDPSLFSSLRWPNRLGVRRAQPPQSVDTTATSDQRLGHLSAEGVMSLEEQEETFVASPGLRSRKKMDDAYRIMNQNDVDRQGGNLEAYITRQLLAQLSANIRPHRAAAGINPDEEDQGGERIILGDDCVPQ